MAKSEESNQAGPIGQTHTVYQVLAKYQCTRILGYGVWSVGCVAEAAKTGKRFSPPAESIVLCQSRLIIAVFIIIIIAMMIKSNWCWSRPDVRLARRCRGLIASEPLREHKPI